VLHVLLLERFLRTAERLAFFAREQPFPHSLRGTGWLHPEILRLQFLASPRAEISIRILVHHTNGNGSLMLPRILTAR
jgi:hypothetical protein